MQGKKYQIVYADPPWELKAGSPNLHAKKQGNRALAYPTMTLEEIKTLPIQAIVEKDAVLFLWTTNKYIEQSYAVARAWGFTPSTMLVWCKKPKGRGLGGTFGISTEYLLFARRGTFKATERHWSTWFEAKRGKHSEKPQIARDFIEKCFEGRKVELFARQLVTGWDVWGNEVESNLELAQLLSMNDLPFSVKEMCESGNQWSDHGAVISGHQFVEVDQPDRTKQVLGCRICGEESVGILPQSAHN